MKVALNSRKFDILNFKENPNFIPIEKKKIGKIPITKNRFEKVFDKTLMRRNKSFKVNKGVRFNVLNNLDNKRKIF